MFVLINISHQFSGNQHISPATLDSLPPNWCGTSPDSIMSSNGPSTKDILLDAVVQELGKDALDSVPPVEVIDSRIDVFHLRDNANRLPGTTAKV